MPKPLWYGGGSLLLAGALLTQQAFGQEAIEEVIVTGSYIKKDSFDSSSPLTVIDSDAISAK